MSKFELREVTYEINRYMPNFKIIDNDIAIEDREKEDGSIAYLHDIDEDTAKSIVEALEKQIQTEEAEAKYIFNKLDSKKEQLTVKDLKEFISELPDNMKIYIVSDDDMPVRKLVDISSETGPCYSELYLDTVEC